MRGWHRKHAEKAIVRFTMGLSEEASEYERKYYKKYGTVVSCIRQLEYDMHHGVQKREVIEIIRNIGQSKKYARVRSSPEARMRLEELESYLSDVANGGKRFDWIQYAYKEKVKSSEGN